MKSRMTGKPSGIILVIVMLLLMSMAGSLIPANIVQAVKAAPSDSKEAAIKQILTKCGAEFGWDQSYCWYGKPAHQGDTAPYHCPRLVGPIAQFESKDGKLVEMPGVAGYYLELPWRSGDTAWLETPFKITAYPTENAAEASMSRSIAAIGKLPQNAFKTTTFHDRPASLVISNLGGTGMSWQMGRFIFTAGGSIDKGVSYQKMAEALYTNSVKYGLIASGGGTVIARDTDGDGVTDDMDRCPGTPAGVAVDASGCPAAKGLKLSVATDKSVYSAGETVIIRGAVSDEQGKLAGAAVVIDVSGTQIVVKTGSSGDYQCNFLIPPAVTQAVYTVLATASFSGYPSTSKSTSFVVGDIGLQLEMNPATGEPFSCVAADGASSLVVSISLPGCSNVKISQPNIGKFEGNALDAMGNLTMDSAGAAKITYFPPAYLMNDQLTRYARQQDSRVWSAVVPVTLTYTDAGGQDGKTEAEILVCRPPVMLVHGFVGSAATWGKMSTYLKGEKFDTFLVDYSGVDQPIEALALVLEGEIKYARIDYAGFNIKLTRVDVVGHSMGGLVSRYYSHGFTDYTGDVRKLIMVGTPNHGVGWLKKKAGDAGSALYGTHTIPAKQLYCESPFIKALNRGEATGAHLNPAVQYGNIYGFPDDWVVSSASAYLNGVAGVTESDVKHSPDIPVVPYVAITEYLKIWEQVKNWLTTDIRRPQLTGSHAEVFKYSGDVYLISHDASGSHENRLAASPTKFELFQSLRTGQDARATIHLKINDLAWGVIFLDPGSEIFLGNCSPQLVEVRLWKGSATFRSKVDGHFTVPVNIQRSETGEWWKCSPQAVVTGLGTEFTVASGESIKVHCFEGKLAVQTPNAATAGSILAANNSVAVAGESVTAINPASKKNLWWAAKDDNFLTSTQAGNLLDKFKDLRDFLSQSDNPLSKNLGRQCPLRVAYGSPGASELYIFRQFRDSFLARHAIGEVVINAYYNYGPFFVELMLQHELLQPAVRYCLAAPAAAILDSTITMWDN